MIVACYAFSLLVVERLFKIVKPKLLTISWFAIVSARTRVVRLFRRWLGPGTRCDTRACQSSRRLS
jgi:hypothetical protein